MSLHSILDKKVLIIAEIAHAHEGKPEIARTLVKRACETGADAIKFQLIFGEELVVHEHPRCAHFTNMEMPKEIWQELIAIVHEAGMQVYADVFGLKAARLGMECGVDGFKVHSSDSINLPLLDYLDQQNRPILLSCGGTKLIEIKWALDRLSKSREAGQIALIHGFQNFPTKLEDTNLKWISEWHSMFQLPVGFMDHVDAEDPMAMMLPVMGVPASARVIEKHITLDRSQKGLDYYSSLHPDEFKTMVQTIRRSEIAFGTLPMTMSPDELAYRKKMKKLLVATRDLTAGECLQNEDLTFKRGDFEGHPLYLSEAIGRILKHPLKADEALTQNHFEQKVGILIAVRMHSTRFPQKALKVVAGQTITEHLIDRVKLSQKADVVVLCTSEEPLDDPLPPLAEKKGIPCIRGSAEDVILRFMKAVDAHNLDIIVRITGDDILIDPKHVDLALDYHLQQNNDYTACKALPSGTEGEVISVSALQRALELAEDSNYSEYMSFYFTNEHFFRTGSLAVEEFFQRNWRLTIDYPEDFEVVRSILEGIYSKEHPYTMEELIEFVEHSPELLDINRQQKQKQPQDSINTRMQLFK